MKWLMKYFVVLPTLYLFVAYCLVHYACFPATAIIDATPDPGAASDPWGQAFAMMLIGVGVIVVIIFLLNLVMKLRSFKLMMIGKLIDMHDAANKDSYHQLWLKRRILNLWKQLNPKCRKKSVSAISAVVVAGYGLMPDEMPKGKKATKKTARRAMPRPANDEYQIEWEKAA